MKNQFYITTSIAYTNAPPHLGFALEVIQADVIARYRRLLGEEVFFLTGTDEHGAKNVKAAEEAGMTPQDFVSGISKQFYILRDVLNLSNDDFIRTTDRKRHWPSAQKVWLLLKKNGDLYKRKYKGLYCTGCEVFITRKDLKDGKCAVHQKEPQVIEEENYFFRLSRYQKQIEKAVSNERLKIIPEGKKNEMLSFLRRGLEDVSFSRPRRDLKWGIPVPDDSNHTMYVWCDALTNYISALGFAKNNARFKKFWPADVHCLGKDILRFHALIWPGMLLSLNLPLPRKIFVHGFITVDGQKMSKSLGNIIDPFGLVEKYGCDPVRYFLLREISPTEDGDFTFNKFEECYNGDLANGLGNLVARVITMTSKLNFKFQIPNSRPRRKAFGFLPGRQIPNSKSQTIINKAWKNYHSSLENFRFNDALVSIWQLISFCDKYIERQKPWEQNNQQSKIKNQKVIYELLFALANIASMLQPFLPETSSKIFKQLGIGLTGSKPWKFKPRRAASLFPRLK